MLSRLAAYPCCAHGGAAQGRRIGGGRPQRARTRSRRCRTDQSLRAQGIVEATKGAKGVNIQQLAERATDRQIAANKQRQKKHRPRSNAGRALSRRSALRHGLAIDIGADPAFQDGIEKLAKKLSCSGGKQKMTECAREAAAAEFDLIRIRKARAVMFKRLSFDGSGPTACST
jgi:hypothetical protein